MQPVQEGETRSQLNFSHSCFHRLYVSFGIIASILVWYQKIGYSNNPNVRCLFIYFKCCFVLECVGLSLWKHDLYTGFLETEENGPLSPRGLCFLGQLYNSGYVLRKRIFFLLFFFYNWKCLGENQFSSPPSAVLRQKEKCLMLERSVICR